MNAPTGRRELIASALRELAGFSLRATGFGDGSAHGDLRDGDQAAPALPLPEPPPAASLTLDMAGLDRLVVETGLEHRREAIKGQARYSLRLVPVLEGPDACGLTRLGGVPACDLDWPMRDGRPLALLAQVDLGMAERATVPRGLPASGLLMFFCDLQGFSTSSEQSVHACRVLLAPAHSATRAREWQDAVALVARPAKLVPELVLPRAWSSVLDQLEMSDDERERWQRVRERLARAQQTAAPESLSVGDELHRLGGFPDERTGDMPLVCELLSRGLEVPEHPQLHPQARTLDPASSAWRLLLQLSLPPDLSSTGSRRCYFWIHEDELAQMRLDGVRALVR